MFGRIFVGCSVTLRAIFNLLLTFILSEVPGRATGLYNRRPWLAASLRAIPHPT